MFDQTIAFLNQTEGRDKFCKVIQYGSRFLMWRELGKNDKIAHRYKGLFEGMRDARKLFRLFKSIVEYHKIAQLQKQKLPQHKKILSIMSRLGFLLYWVFDNLQILSKVKFIEGVDRDKAGKRAATFWLIALVFSIALVFVQMFEAAQEEAQLKVALNSRQYLEEKSQEVLLERYAQLKKKKLENILNLLKNLGDMVTASQAIGLPRRFFGFDFNDGHVGAGGLLSAVITCYQLFPAKK